MDINHLLEKHTAGDGEYKIALSTLLSLSSRIGLLFDGSTNTEKRRLIGFVFTNLELEGSKLRFSLRKTFDLFVDLAECQNWRQKLDILRTDYKAEILLACQIIPLPIRERLGLQSLAA